MVTSSSTMCAVIRDANRVVSSEFPLRDVRLIRLPVLPHTVGKIHGYINCDIGNGFAGNPGHELR
jgi:hypothetical protein